MIPHIKKMINDNHIIQKLIFEFDIDSSLNLYPFKSDIFDSISSNRVFTVVDNCFGDFCNDNQNIPVEIEKLEIDLGTLLFEDICNITERIRSKLEKELEEIDIGENDENINFIREAETRSIKSGSQEPLKKKENFREKIDLNSGIIIFKHYLKHGILPWWASPDSIKLNEIADLLIREAKDIFPDILKNEFSDERILRRAIYSFPDRLLQNFVENISPEKERIVNKIKSDLKNLIPHVQKKTLNSLKEKMWISVFTRKEQDIVSGFLNFADNKEIQELFSAIEKSRISYNFKTKLPFLLERKISDLKISPLVNTLPEKTMKEKASLKQQKEPKNIESSAVVLSEALKKAISNKSSMVSLIEESSDEYLIKLVQSDSKGVKIEIGLYRELFMVLSGIRILRDADKLLLRTIIWESFLKDEENILLKRIMEKISERLFLPKEDLYNEFFKGLYNLKKAGYCIFFDYSSMIDANYRKTVKEFIKEVKPENITEISAEDKEIVKTEKKRQKVKSPFPTEDEIYVTNAGIILLWPYLSGFFSKLKLTENNQFVSMNNRMKAISLINYISFGAAGSEEFLLPLSKILTGIELDEPVDVNMSISNSDKNECENLLNAVIYNWGALKSTSADGLRNAFFLREGVIKFKNGSYLLYIEKKTHDILLDKLPWSINIVKLPWMQNLLFVEW